MRNYALSFAALAVIASTNAFPVVNYDVTQWATDYVWGGNNIQLGLGWKADGTVAAGAKIWAGNSVPVAAAVSTNIKNMKNVEYEVGAGELNAGRVASTGNVVVAGDNNGKLKYTIGAALPGTGQSVTGSIVGDHTEIKTIGVSVGNSVDSLSAAVQLDQYKPQSASIEYGSSRVI